MRKPHDLFKSQYTQISFYVVLTFVALVVVYGLLGNLGQVGRALVGLVSPLHVVAKPLIGGLVIAYLLLPIVRRIQALLQRIPFLAAHEGSSRVLSIALAVVVIVAAVLATLVLMLVTLTNGIASINFSHASDLVGSLSAALASSYGDFKSWLAGLNIQSDELSAAVEAVSQVTGDYVAQLGDSVVEAMRELPSVVTNLVFSLIFAVYLMLDTEGIGGYWDGVLLRLVGEKNHRLVHTFLDDADRAFSGYIRGQLIDALFMALAAGIVLALVGVRFPLLIGVLAGIGNLIPYVGPIVGFACTALVCLLEGNLQTLVAGFVALGVVQFVDANVVNPRLLASNVQVHPLLVIAALLLGGEVGGFVGMIVAVPVASLLQTVFERLVAYVGQRRGIPLPAEGIPSVLGDERDDVSSDENVSSEE